MTARWIELDGTVNTRDVGGAPTADGAVVRSGKLLRSDNLQDLSDADVAHLVDRLKLSDVIDVRTHTELALTKPSPLHQTPVTHHHLSLIPGDHRPLTAQEASAATNEWVAYDADKRHDEAYWTTHYLEYLENRPESVTAAVQIIGESQGAALVHCAAGKDRTGMVVAMALGAVGVTDDAIVADYLASATRIGHIVAKLAAEPVYGMTNDPYTVVQQTPSEANMRGILAALQSEFGGAAGWLQQHGFSTSDLAQLRATLVQ